MCFAEGAAQQHWTHAHSASALCSSNDAAPDSCDETAAVNKNNIIKYIANDKEQLREEKEQQLRDQTSK
jgi:hypothetical protein